VSGIEEIDDDKWTGTGQHTTNFTTAGQSGEWQDTGQENQTIVEPGGTSTKAADEQVPAQSTWSDAGQSAVESSPWWPEQ
jgi:hypothetical protein